MSTMLIQSGTLDDIADAIRAKTGGVATMTPLEMPTEIANIVGGGGDITLLHSAGLTRSEIIDNPPTTYTFTKNYDTIYVVGSISDNDAQAGCKLTYNGNGTATEIDSKSGVYSSTDSINTKILKIKNVSANESVEIARSSTDGLTGTWFIFSAVEQGDIVGHVCTNAQIANSSSYLTAPTDLDAFSFDYLLISLMISGTEYLTGINVSDISSGVDFIVNSHRGYNVMKMQLTPTTVAATYFTGSYLDIYCTIYGINV